MKKVQNTSFITNNMSYETIPFLLRYFNLLFIEFSGSCMCCPRPSKYQIYYLMLQLRVSLRGGRTLSDIICSEKLKVFRGRSSRKNVSFEYPSIFSHQMDAIVFIIVQTIFATRVVWKIGEYSWIFPSFSWRIFGHVTCLDQSRSSENS